MWIVNKNCLCFVNLEKKTVGNNEDFFQRMSLLKRNENKLWLKSSDVFKEGVGWRESGK